MALPRLKRRQLALGGLDGFEPAPRSPNDDMVNVAAGFFEDWGANSMTLTSSQTTPAFAPVTGAGRVRWDLVYVDHQGNLSVESGVEQVTPVPQFTGAPGLGAPYSNANVFPIAYVQVDEFAPSPVVVSETDIYDLRMYYRDARHAIPADLQTDDNVGAGSVGTSGAFLSADHKHPPNVDLVNPQDVAAGPPAPGASAVYSRRDHVHQINPALLAGLVLPGVRSTDCLWGPRSPAAGGNPQVQKWVLQQFRAKAYLNPNVWFDVNELTPLLLRLWPVNAGGDGALGPNVGPGFADETNPLDNASLNGWLGVYVLGDSTGVLPAAIVYSTNMLPVGPVAGPAIGGGVNPLFVGYDCFALVTCIELSGNLCAVPPGVLPVAARKYDNLVIKEWFTGTNAYWQNRGSHGQALFWLAPFLGVVSLAEHISPLASAAFINWQLVADNSGGLGAQTALEVGLPPGVPLGFQDPPDFYLNEYYKSILADAWVNLEIDRQFDGFWCPTDAFRNLFLNISISAAGLVAGQVVAYIESPDWDISARNWAL